MKIQFLGNSAFLVEGKDVKIAFDPMSGLDLPALDFATNSGGGNLSQTKEVKKTLDLPGEYEISGALIMGFYSSSKNVVYKVVTDDVSLVHFGNLSEIPESKFFDKLGENIDVIFVVLSDSFNEKIAKELIEKLEPRMAILGGDVSYFPKKVESMGAKTLEENPLKISKSQLSDENTEVVILGVV